MSGKNGQPGSDANLFRQALDGVTPIKDGGRVAPARPKPEPVPLAPRRDVRHSEITDTLSDHGAGSEPISEFLRNGVSQMTLRKLRRGQFPLQDSLDLHGLASDEARALLLTFLREATARGLRCISVIHGKGQHGAGEGILKIRARHWLAQCPEVLAFCEAPPRHGGGGAVWVLLKVYGGSPH